MRHTYLFSHSVTSVSLSGTCPTATWSPDCQYPCSSICSPARCERNSGYCSVCSSSTYGGHCEHNCSSFCSPDGCARNTGNCHACQQFRYGDECQYNCPLNCHVIEGSGACNRSNGECLHGCQKGYDGPLCSIEIENQHGADVASRTAVIGIAVGTAFTGIIIGIIASLVLVLLRKRKAATQNKHYLAVSVPSVLYINTTNNIDSDHVTGQPDVSSVHFTSTSDLENIADNIESDHSTRHPEVLVPSVHYMSMSDLENIADNIDSDHSTGQPGVSVPLEHYINTMNKIDSDHSAGHPEVSVPSVRYINTSNSENITANVDSDHLTRHLSRQSTT